MTAAFIIWSAVSVLFIFIGLRARTSEKPAGFWANAKPPEVKDIKAYNRAVCRLFIWFAALFELVGVPLLFCKQNAAIAVITITGTVLLVIGIMIVYTRLEIRYKK